MKKRLVNKAGLTGLVCALALFIGGAATLNAADDGGRLIVTRSPRLGTGNFLDVSVDGKKVASLGTGKKYDAMVSPGKHTVSASMASNLHADAPSKVEFTAAKGDTYAFSATIKSGAVVLVKSK
jgi:hypothetical protein